MPKCLLPCHLLAQLIQWVNVLFGEFFGWVAGWALLAEYFIAVAFVASGFSANLRGLISPLGINYLHHYQLHLRGGIMISSLRSLLF